MTVVTHGHGRRGRGGDVCALDRETAGQRRPERQVVIDGRHDQADVVTTRERPDFIDLVLETKPDQCTLVPVTPGEITSQAGWSAETSPERLTAIVKRLQLERIRVSIFVDPMEGPIRWAKRIGADRIELYTEPFAKDFHKSEASGRASFAAYAASAELAHSLGMGINAGHDLDLDNLVLFKQLPHLDEVSIGHALLSRALFHGLDKVVREYLTVLR